MERVEKPGNNASYEPQVLSDQLQSFSNKSTYITMNDDCLCCFIIYSTTRSENRLNVAGKGSQSGRFLPGNDSDDVGE